MHWYVDNSLPCISESFYAWADSYNSHERSRFKVKEAGCIGEHSGFSEKKGYINSFVVILKYSSLLTYVIPGWFANQHISNEYLTTSELIDKVIWNKWKWLSLKKPAFWLSLQYRHGVVSSKIFYFFACYTQFG